MKYIIAGSREITDKKTVFNLIDSLNLDDMDIIISGQARGVDFCGEQYAKERKISLKVFPANWDVYGKSAGYRRNVEMAKVADALILIWDGKSKGSGHMKNIAKEKGLTIYEFVV